MMNFGKKIAVGVASAALVASMGAMAPAAVADSKDVTNFGFVNILKRLGGMDRISTSLAVADHEFGQRDGKLNNAEGKQRGPRPNVLYITSMADANLVDAASAGMLQDGPIAYVANNSYVAEAVGDHFKDTTAHPGYAAIKKVIAIGGEGAISDATLKTVAGRLGSNVATSRLGGKDRYETSTAIASRIYDLSLQKDNYYEDHNGDKIVNDSTSNLKVAYLANADNSHVVDSMVAGTLDNGPVLLVQPDGKIPEPVKKFIEKSLPEQFAVLGGAETVSDSTVTEAWLIKTLANKWETSSNIPDLYKDKEKLKNLVYGIDGSLKNDRDITSDHFMGLQQTIGHTESILNNWNLEVEKLKNAIREATHDAATTELNGATGTQFGSESIGFYHDVLHGNTVNTPGARIHDALLKLYGNIITSGNRIIKSDIVSRSAFNLDSANAHNVEADFKIKDGFDFSDIEGSGAYRDQYNKGKDDLDNHWAVKSNPGLSTAIQTDQARASQNMVKDNSAITYTSKDNGAGVSIVVIRDLANYTYECEKTWYKEFKAMLEDKEQKLRVEQDKIAPKTELRLGGKDRFETAALIANQYGNLYGGVVGNFYTPDQGKPLPGRKHTPFREAYVANGLRLADSLTAGQLSRGPIMLVTQEGDLPEFTKTVADKLPLWTKAKSLAVYGIGEKGVLPDAQLKSIAERINHGRGAIPEVGGGKKAPLSETITVKASQSKLSNAVIEADASKHSAYTVVVLGGAATATKPTVSLDAATGKLNVNATSASVGTYTVNVYKGSELVKTFTVEVVAKEMKFMQTSTQVNAAKGVKGLAVSNNTAVGTFYYDVDDKDGKNGLDGTEASSVAAVAKLKVLKFESTLVPTLRQDNGSVGVDKINDFEASVAAQGVLQVTTTANTLPGRYTVAVPGYGDYVFTVNQAALAAPTGNWDTTTNGTLTSNGTATWTPNNNKAEAISGVTYKFEANSVKFGAAGAEAAATKVSDTEYTADNGNIVIKIDPATGVVTVTDAGFAGAVSKNILFKVTASKTGETDTNSAADITVTTNRAS